MNYFDIWAAGSKEADNKNGVTFLGTASGETFENACAQLVIDKTFLMRHYNEDDNTYNGCKLFESEKDARNHS